MCMHVYVRQLWTGGHHAGTPTMLLPPHVVGHVSMSVWGRGAVARMASLPCLAKAGRPWPTPAAGTGSGMSSATRGWSSAPLMLENILALTPSHCFEWLA